MTDRELLTLAAKAADLVATPEGEVLLPAGPATGDCRVWDPLKDDGDALRLAVKLKLDLRFPQDNDMYVDAGDCDGYTVYLIDCDGDRAAATRRAIVNAAAAIGEKQ